MSPSNNFYVARTHETILKFFAVYNFNYLILFYSSIYFSFVTWVQQLVLVWHLWINPNAVNYWALYFNWAGQLWLYEIWRWPTYSFVVKDGPDIHYLILFKFNTPTTTIVNQSLLGQRPFWVELDYSKPIVSPNTYQT